VAGLDVDAVRPRGPDEVGDGLEHVTSLCKRSQ
jgi:hypothetical protein